MFRNFWLCFVHINIVLMLIQEINLDPSFLINVSKNGIDSCSIMDIVGPRAPTKQIRDFSASNVPNVSGLAPSMRCTL
jgi:hypothetical protein